MQHSQKSPSAQPSNHRRSLHRTLSDESIYRGQRLPVLSDSVTEPTLGADVLFSCSTLPRSPTTRGVPLRRPSYKLGVKLHGEDEDRPLCNYSINNNNSVRLLHPRLLFLHRWPFSIRHVIGGPGGASSRTPPTGADAPPILRQGQSPGMDTPGGRGQYLWDGKKHALW